MWGRKTPCNYTAKRERSTWLRCRHVDQVNTCVTVLVRAHCVLLTHMSDGVQLRVVAHTAQCVRVVCSVSVLFVCTFFLRLGRCTRSHRTGLCQHAFRKGETSVHCTPHVWDTHSPNLCARSTRIPSHLLSPGLPGN